jgi:carbonic anhydrase/acetyltransferase-like protein (isoleucine patch superfamily)
MSIYSIESSRSENSKTLTPSIHETAWVAPGAHVLGQVQLMTNANVWFGAVIRADNEPITVGPNSNIQEGAVLHVDPGCPLVIGENVTIGHQAMLHGCTIGDGSLIGIQAVILNRVVIGKNCLIGAGSLIPEGKVIPDRSLVMGTPGKVIRQLDDDEVAKIADGAANYVERAQGFKATLKILPS